MPLYFPPGLQLHFQPHSITNLWPVSSYTAVVMAVCEQLAQTRYTKGKWPEVELATARLPDYYTNTIIKLSGKCLTKCFESTSNI